MFKISNYTWLFGDNQAITAMDNSYYFWKHIVNIKDNIEKYIVLEKDDFTLKIYSELSKYEKQFVLWKNSKNHYQKFRNCDLLFINDSPKDIIPDSSMWETLGNELKKSIIHLHNSNQAINAVNEMGNSYDNNILRFCVYNPEITDTLINENKFEEYQLHHSEFQPKYYDLLKKDSEITDKKQILIDLSSKDLISEITTNETLNEYLNDEDLKLKILDDTSKVDMNLEIAKSKFLISDNSSVINDFIFLEKPIILYNPNNNLNCPKEAIVKNPQELVSKIISEDYSMIPKNSNKITDDNYIKELYDYFKRLQENKITFLGFNFYGIGGTVNATMSLAEALLEQDCFVSLLSLKKIANVNVIPCGLNIDYITWDNSKSYIEKFSRFTHRSSKNYHHLSDDFGKEHIHPYVGYALDKLMKSIKTKTLVSTRESLHLFLNDCTSENVENKIYFFHTNADLLKKGFPEAMNKLKEITIDKAVFITENNRIAIKNEFDYDNYNSYIILGNTLKKSHILDIDEIEAVGKKDKYSAIYLLRISKDRENDLNRLIQFGQYVKENSITNIEIDVFGDGDYSKEFVESINSKGLENIIHYKKSTENPIDEIRNHDLMIDFSLNHSFGMTYIEGILNGKKVFCMENIGSEEVMGDIPNSFIISDEWLCEQINNLDEIQTSQLKENYEKIQEKYSHLAIATKFLNFLN